MNNIKQVNVDMFSVHICKLKDRIINIIINRSSKENNWEQIKLRTFWESDVLTNPQGHDTRLKASKLHHWIVQE